VRIKTFNFNKSARQSPTKVQLKVQDPDKWPRFSSSKICQPIYLEVDGYEYQIILTRKSGNGSESSIGLSMGSKNEF